ncbi:MAG: TonB-dependent receptor [Oceanicoccus sp.]|nr:TonB-dependent receptor [Oceanicoccus sp.]
MLKLDTSTSLAVLLITNLALPLHAETKNSIETTMETTIVTATRTQQNLTDSAASLSVISREELLQISAVHINETLARVPGVWISRGNGQEHLTAIRSPVLTGAGSCGAFTVAEDGVPVRATGFCNVNQLFDINTEQAQRIEVLRGPGTVLHGSDALHGVINVISQPAVAAQQQLNIEAGSNDYYRIKFSQSNRSGQHGYRLNLNGAHDGGYKDDSGFDQQKMTARHDYNADKLKINTLLSISNLNQETAGFVAGTDAYKDSDRRRENPNPEAYRDSQSLRLQTSIEKSLNNGGVFIITPYARYTNMEFLMHFLPGTPLEENSQKSAGVQSSYQRTLSDTLTLRQGFDAELTDAFLKQSQQGGFSSFPAGKQYDYEVEAIMLATFISADYRLQADTVLSFGGRYEYLEYDYDNQIISGNTAEDGSTCINGFTGAEGCRYTRPEDSKDDFDNISANASLNHQLNQQLNTYLRFAHGFRVPQATEMYRLQNGQMEAGLDSEEINSIEWGLRGSSESLQYSLSSFYMRKTNVIFQSSQRLNIDDGQTEHLGLEYELLWQLGKQWDLRASGTFARHKYSSDVSLFGSDDDINLDGNDVDTTPRRMSTVQLGWQPTVNTRAELEWLSMGRYYTDIDNLHSYEGHDLIHLRVRQQLNNQVSVGLRVNNLTNEDYAERADFSSFSGDRYFIGEPRSYYADISIAF